jgi:hypothetical protein
MHEVKRYDGQGNLIEIISVKTLNKELWASIDNPLQTRKAAIERGRVTNQCEWHLCKKNFHPPGHRPDTKFCSKKCRQANYQKKILLPQKAYLCLLCLKPGYTARRKQRFCNNPCTRKLFQKVERHADGGRKTHCHYCGGKFQAGRAGNQKYCVMPYFVNALQCRTLANMERKRNNLS